MPFRATLTAVAAAAAACLLLAPAALASSQSPGSSRQPVQVTGKQLKSALLPASDFVAGYATASVHDSGGSLEHSTVFKVPSLSCRNFWAAIGISQGFGETAFAASLVGIKSDTATVLEMFTQSVYQFASARAAALFYSQVNDKYQSCKSASASDGQGGTAQITVHSQSKQRVGGHEALRLIVYLTDSKVASTAVPEYVLWTIDGTDAYLISTVLINTKSPQPTQSSLTLKLIARVSALR
jgi:hypothetical protein